MAQVDDLAYIDGFEGERRATIGWTWLISLDYPPARPKDGPDLLCRGLTDKRAE
jgi:hypothetical protein